MEFDKLIRLQLDVAFVCTLLAFMGLFVLFAMTWPGCTPSNIGATSDESNRQAHLEEIRRRRDERCEEMLVEGDIDSMRDWCLSPLVRETARERACEMVETYEQLCAN